MDAELKKSGFQQKRSYRVPIQKGDSIYDVQKSLVLHSTQQ